MIDYGKLLLDVLRLLNTYFTTETCKNKISNIMLKYCVSDLEVFNDLTFLIRRYMTTSIGKKNFLISDLYFFNYTPKTKIQDTPILSNLKTMQLIIILL